MTPIVYKQIERMPYRVGPDLWRMEAKRGESAQVMAIPADGRFADRSHAAMQLRAMLRERLLYGLPHEDSFIYRRRPMNWMQQLEMEKDAHMEDLTRKFDAGTV